MLSDRYKDDQYYSLVPLLLKLRNSCMHGSSVGRMERGSSVGRMERGSSVGRMPDSQSREPVVTVSKFGHFLSLHDASVDSAV